MLPLYQGVKIIQYRITKEPAKGGLFLKFPVLLLRRIHLGAHGGLLRRLHMTMRRFHLGIHLWVHSCVLFLIIKVHHHSTLRAVIVIYYHTWGEKSTPLGTLELADLKPKFCSYRHMRVGTRSTSSPSLLGPRGIAPRLKRPKRLVLLLHHGPMVPGR